MNRFVATFPDPHVSFGAASPLVGKAGGPFIGPRGGKWKDPQHKIPWKEKRVDAAEKAIENAIDEVLAFNRDSGKKHWQEMGIVIAADGSIAEQGKGEPEKGSVKLDEDGVAFVHSHPDNWSLSHGDVIQLAKRARNGSLRTMIAAAHGLHGEVIYRADLLGKPWSNFEWNSEILPALERAEKRISRASKKEYGQDVSSQHELWEWATTRGPLKGRMKYTKIIRKKSLRKSDVHSLLDHAGVAYLGVRVSEYEEGPKTIQVTFADFDEAERFKGMATGPAIEASMGSRETRRGTRYEVVLSSRPEDSFAKSAKAPPPGYTAIPGTTIGGYHKRGAHGRFFYWYPTGALERPDPTKTKPRHKKGPKLTSVGPQAEGVPAFADSRADPKVNPGLAKIEGGVFAWARSQSRTPSADGRSIRKTEMVFGVDEETKMQLVNEFTPLIRGEAKRAMRLYAIKDWGGTRKDIERGGMEGLLNAIHDYKAKGPFSLYAKLYVRDYTAREAGREFQGAIDLPDVHVKNIGKFIAARVQTQVYGKTTRPTIEQIAKNFDLRLKHIHKLESHVERAKQRKVPGVDLPKQPQVPKTFDIEMEDGTTKTIDRNDLVPMQGYKLGIGRRGKVKVKVRNPAKRGEKGKFLPQKEREAKGMRKVKTQKSRVEWAQMYSDFLDGQKNLERLDAGDVFNDLAVGRGFSDEEAALVRMNIASVLRNIDLGDTIIKVAKPGSRQKPAQYSVADLGDVVARRLGLGDYEQQSIRRIAQEVPFYTLKDDDWVESSAILAQTHLQKFIDIGMERLKTATRRKEGGSSGQIAVASVVDRAADLVAPKETIPRGASYGELVKQEASKLTDTQAAGWIIAQARLLKREASKQRNSAKQAVLVRRRNRVLRMGVDDAKIEMAKGTGAVQEAKAEIRRQLGKTIDIERTGSRDGIAHVYDPSTGLSKPMKIGLGFSAGFEEPTLAGQRLPASRRPTRSKKMTKEQQKRWQSMFGIKDVDPVVDAMYTHIRSRGRKIKKGFAHLTGAILREVQRWPELMTLLIDADESAASRKVERLAGVR